MAVRRKSMPVTESFLRTSIWPEVMKNMELPGAPSRTMIWLGGKSRRFIRLTTSEHSRMESPLKSLMRWRKCWSGAAPAAAGAGEGAAAAPVEPSADMDVVIAALAGVDIGDLLLKTTGSARQRWSQSYPNYYRGGRRGLYLSYRGEADGSRTACLQPWDWCLR